MEKGDLPGPVRPDRPNPAERFWVKKLNPGQMVLSAFADNLSRISEPRPLCTADACILLQRLGLSWLDEDSADVCSTIEDAFEGDAGAAFALVKRVLPGSRIRVRGSTGRTYVAIWRNGDDTGSADGQSLRAHAALAILSALFAALNAKSAPGEPRAQ